MKNQAILFSADQIQERVKQLANEINTKYEGKELVVICVLKGGVMFFADIVKNITLDVQIDFLTLSSYNNTTESTTQVKIVKDITLNIENKHVIIIEDIIDSGHTLLFMKNHFNSLNVASLEVCSLLNKQSRREVEVSADYIGFEVEDQFVVGYGLDYAQKYRNLPYIADLAE